MNLDYFKAQEQFYKGLQTLFNALNIPVNYIDEKPLRPQDILSKTYKDTNRAYQLMGDVYILGMVDDKAFSNPKSADIFEIKKQEKGYDGILIFGVTLTDRKRDLLPTRTQLAEITRAFNREFYYTPVVVVFRYADFISLANTERQKYKQEWREGEKAGKVSILRDIEIENPHTGHLKILEELKITRSGKKGINSFEGLYLYWQEVFSVNLLNKKFYSELSNWYFWAVKHVTFPSEPTIHTLFAETGSNDNKKLEAMKQEFNAKNVIRLLTRLLFVWFIKEKKLIPEDLFNLETLQKNILKKISPFHEKDSLFKEENKESIYYKAILQNLFFATLNCPVKPDSTDTQERGFRRDESYGKHRGIDYLMRYKKYFKDPDAFLEMVNTVVPFLNGGLFECLDDKDKKIYIDGFSDNMSKTDGVANHLVVPDYLFFGSEEKTDLSSDYGTKDKGTKEAAVKGLINILKSYKFTIAENTPIEEDVALDPELLGKVFENLLASYNPETKTTARKQTGSFYTPREIVNYMVDESLIAHLKKSVSWDMDEKELDEKLHKLLSFEPVNPFEHSPGLSQKIIHSLDNCKILDPACGSGAFPMGILQKMVHILQKVDPDNEYWQELQLEKAQKATEGVFIIKDKEERKLLLDEINEAFDETINNPDYARKLFLIENCIYGVDIQPIAAQISKLRFFISLVVEQKVNKEKDNFGIRPLPNLETKFVTANTLIGIDKPDGELFYTREVQEKEAELKAIRHKLFGAKTKATKMKYRKKDEELRNEIADILKKGCLPVESAEQLASWDPYDQNGVSPFFDPEWMFDIKDGFDIVIGNPPYIGEKGNKKIFRNLSDSNMGKRFYQRKMDLFYFFFHISLDLLKKNGVFSYITTNYFPTADAAKKLRTDLKERSSIIKLVNFNEAIIFESAKGQHNLITVGLKSNSEIQLKTEVTFCKGKEIISLNDVANILTLQSDKASYQYLKSDELFDGINAFIRFESGGIVNILNKINLESSVLKDYFNVNQGILSGADKVSNKHINGGLVPSTDKGKGIYVLTNEEVNALNLTPTEKMLLKKFFKNSDVLKYSANTKSKMNLLYLTRDINLDNFPNIKKHLEKYKKIIKNRSTERGEIQAALKLGKWWVIFAARNKSIFEGEKIISPQRSHRNTFAYNNTEWFSSADVYYITAKPNSRFSIKYLLGILNSSICYQWLYRKGKRKGEMLELYATPLENIPIKLGAEKFQKTLKFNTSILIQITDDKKIFTYQSVNDALVFELYFPDHMKERKIDVLQFVEKDIDEVMQGNEFDTLTEIRKEQAISELHSRWSDPGSEIVKRMNSFSEKSPEILKPILEG